MDSKEKKDKGIAVAATIVVHALAVLVLVLMAFKTPTPLPAEEGVEINLGSSDEGLGEIQPEKLESQKKSTTSPQTKQETSKSEEKNITDDNSENSPINESKKPKTKTESKEQPKKEENKYYKASNNPDPSNSNDDGSLGELTTKGPHGDTKGDEDQGQPDGTLNGVNYRLKGRGAKNLVNDPLDDLDQGGIVVVEIWVNPKGKVIRAKAPAKGTTASKTSLFRIAEKYALSSEFYSKEGAPAEQYGTLEYNFHVNYNK